ncbi:MAG: DUF2167 domain-containing protein [Stenomitos rutilans HA7619-LM2]|jgi:uncharacterized membrane-anchored protein|nr:DUF2167 domain-containing protein [Stenomitos rutilans HA7619-LM2]
MSTAIRSPFRICLFFIVGLLITLNLTPVFAAATPPKVNWTAGPKAVSLGDNLAQLKVPKGYLFANADDTRKLMTYLGNPTSNDDIGMVVPNDNQQDWLVVFSYNPIGYVKDDDSQSIDKDAILQSIKNGTEEDNKKRQAQGGAPILITGWQEPPHYDPASHDLVWSIAATEDGKPLINYNTRKLGRNGVTAINLVTSPANLPKIKPELNVLIANYAYIPGKQYSDFVSGQDKVAEIGLTALIAGGAGAAAAKTGLLAKLLLILGVVAKKLWFLIILALAGLKQLFGGKKTQPSSDTATKASVEDQSADKAGD